MMKEEKARRPFLFACLFAGLSGLGCVAMCSVLLCCGMCGTCLVLPALWLSQGAGSDAAMATPEPRFRKPAEIRDLQFLDGHWQTVAMPTGLKVEYSVSHELDGSAVNGQLYQAYGPDFIGAVIADTAVELKGFLRAQDIDYGDCRTDHSVAIFVIRAGVLNDRERFPHMFNGNNANNAMYILLDALYRRTSDMRAKSVILLTDPAPDSRYRGRINQALLAHEMAHYWFDRLCLSSDWPGSTEEFATEFMAYYEPGMKTLSGGTAQRPDREPEVARDL